MTKTLEHILLAAILVPVAISLWYAYASLRKIAKKNKNVEERADLWIGKDYRCPECQTQMEQGYTLTGKGIIWAPRFGKKISAFAHTGQVLDNTMSLRMSPALNMAWRCTHCSYVLIDHSKLVIKEKRDS